MLALNATHYDDRRLCSTKCDESSVIVYDIPTCAGLCNATAELLELAADPACHTPAVQPSGYLPLVPPAYYFDGQADPDWDRRAVEAIRLQRRRAARNRNRSERVGSGGTQHAAL